MERPLLSKLCSELGISLYRDMDSGYFEEADRLAVYYIRKGTPSIVLNGKYKLQDIEKRAICSGISMYMYDVLPPEDKALVITLEDVLFNRSQTELMAQKIYTIYKQRLAEYENERKETKMNNEITIFNNSEFGDIRTISDGSGKVLFCGKDVATALGYKETAKAIREHCKGVSEIDTPSNGGIQKMKYITEGDVYRLTFGSKLPSAERFTDWVADEILPTIRKHGAYMTEQTLEQALTSPDFLIQLATQLKTEKDKNKALEGRVSSLTVDNQIMQPKADYFDDLVDRNLLTGIRETAKELKVKQNVFVNFLLEKKYLYRDKKGKLVPYSKHIDAGLFEVKEFVNDKTGFGSTQTLITPKGKETFRLLLLGA